MKKVHINIRIERK